MYGYRKTESNLWTVGHYAPTGGWSPESDHDTREAAVRRVHYLNGGLVREEMRSLLEPYMSQLITELSILSNRIRLLEGGSE